MILENDVSQYDSYMDFDGKDHPFHGLLNTCTIQTNLNIKVVNKYIKYITKD